MAAGVTFFLPRAFAASSFSKMIPSTSGPCLRTNLVTVDADTFPASMRAFTPSLAVASFKNCSTRWRVFLISAAISAGVMPFELVLAGAYARQALAPVLCLRRNYADEELAGLRITLEAPGEIEQAPSSCTAMTCNDPDASLFARAHLEGIYLHPAGDEFRELLNRLVERIGVTPPVEAWLFVEVFEADLVCIRAPDLLR